MSVTDGLPNFKQADKKIIKKEIKKIVFLTCCISRGAYTWQAWTYAVMICGSCQELNFSNCGPRHKQLCQHLALLLNWSAITEVSWWTLPSLFFFLLCSASTLAAVQTPTDNNWHRWWAETQKDRQRKRTTHRSKKTGRLYTHCPREDIAWQYYQLIYFKPFFFFLFLFFSLFLIFSFFYFFKLFIFFSCFQHMPYENFGGIIKVPERIARFSACIAVCIYKFVCTVVGQKQTALQYWVYLHPGQRERSMS